MKLLFLSLSFALSGIFIDSHGAEKCLDVRSIFFSRVTIRGSWAKVVKIEPELTGKGHTDCFIGDRVNFESEFYSKELRAPSVILIKPF